MRKLEKGTYITDNGFIIHHDTTIEGECKWQITHGNQDIARAYELEGFDVLHSTLREAREYCSDLSPEDLSLVKVDNEWVHEDLVEEAEEEESIDEEE